MQDNHDPLRKIPTKHVPEARADIGAPLKAARSKKGHTLETVAQQTRIPKKFLDALENNRLEEFPALAYLRGFLKSYCDYLEVDFEPLWKELTAAPAKEPTPAPAPVAAKPAPTTAPVVTKAEPIKAKAPEPVHAPAPAPKAKAEPKAAPKKKEEPKPMAHAKPAHGHDAHGHGHDDHGHAHAPSNTGPVGPVMLALLAGVLGSIAFFASTNRVPEPPKAEAPAGLAATKPPVERVVTLTFHKEAFLSVVLDGKKVFEAKVPEGGKQEWKTDKTIELKLSNPEAASAAVNGTELKLPAPDASGTIKLEAQ